MAAERIVVVGSINCDVATYVARFPQPNETLFATSVATTLGGKGFNQAIAAARAGAAVAFVGCIGADAMGDKALAALAAEGIDTSQVERMENAPTGTATILVNARGENMIAVLSGANALLQPHHIEKAGSLVTQARALLVQCENPLETVEAALHSARNNGITTILNPAPADRALKDLMRDVDILVPNETEAAILTGTDNESVAITRLHEAGARSVILTRGEKGCLLSTDGKLENISAYRVEAVDATGAGDVFCGVLTLRIADGAALGEAAQYASAAAAISVTRKSAQSAPTRAEIDQFISKR